ncbi:hypothetical protein C8R46DRAFT_1078161 [Mycena filopes]|nr:hypothetical protein C8R46DRAFT_1078161 [Mycena filopes]
MRAAVDGLSTTSSGYLTTSSPLRSTDAPPALQPFIISPMRRESRYSTLLDRPVASAREQELVDALREAEQRDEARKRLLIDTQAKSILTGLHTRRVSEQLQAQEDKKKRKGGKRKMGDGRPKLLTGDEFFDLCQEDAEKKEREGEEKEARKEQRAAHAEKLAQWQANNKQIRARNETKKAQYKADTEEWLEEKELAKAEKRKPEWLKPALKDYGVEKLLPRPKKAVVDSEDEDEESPSGSGMDTD